MQTESLIRMANQIGQFFDTMPDRSEAAEGVAQHIRKFWDPRMRRQFLAHVDGGAPGLHALVAQVVREYRSAIE